MEEDYAVVIKNAYKSYGEKVILDNFCMHVKRGIIYGLLGPSGCGKTTLLSSIVGIKYFDKGEAWVLGGKPGSSESGVPGKKVGYMPQDVALIDELTVKETIFFFGRIFNKSESYLEARYIELKCLLDLPPDERMINQCSGGQQRRVSFAAAMVHKPELLIMDEPTVGLDPVLRDRIWEYLVEVTKKENIAVIITTHYIEEARAANTIGLMREGRLLAEESPNALLQKYQKDSLEEVFLLLSQKQDDGQMDILYTRNQNQNQNTNQSIANVNPRNSYSMNNSKEILVEKNNHNQKVRAATSLCLDAIAFYRMKALLIKNFMQYSRNLSGVCWTLAFPILQIMIFFSAIGTDIKGVNLAIINDENVNNMCGSYKTLKTVIFKSNDSDCYFNALSCRFIEELSDPMFTKVMYNDFDVAKEAVQKGDAVGILYMHKNFTQAFQSRFDDGRLTNAETIDMGEIKVWLDMSNRQIGSVIKAKLYKKYSEFMKHILRDCKYSEKLGNTPIRFEKPVYGNLDDEFKLFMVSGILLSFIFYMGTTMTSTTIISDRKEGVWDRTIVCGVTSVEILMTHLITQFILILMQVVEMFILTFVIYNIYYVGSMPVLVLLSCLQGLSGMCYGFFLSIVSDNHNMAFISATGSFFPMIIICGLLWPLEGQPIVLRWISLLTPFTIPTVCFRNVMIRGWSVQNFDVFLGLIVEVIWIILLTVVNLILIKKKR